MNVRIIKGAEVIRPATTSLPSTLLDHFPAHLKHSFGLSNNAGLWISYNELDFNYGLALCESGDLETSEGRWIPAEEFVLQSGVSCKAVGLDKEDQASEVERVFGEIESRGLESHLIGSEAFSIYDALTNPEGLTTALPASGITGAFAVHVALAQLEGAMAANYAGVATIHMPRAAMSMLGGRIKWIDGLAYTDSGSKVVAGGGYDTTTGGHWQMWATGEVYIEASEEIDVQAYVIPGDGSTYDDNTVLAVAERMYRVAFDGPIYTATAVVF